MGLLTIAKFAYSNAHHSISQMTQFLANSGFHCLFVSCRLTLQELQAIFQVLLDQFQKSNEVYKKFTYWHHRVSLTLAVGDLVWISAEHLTTSEIESVVPRLFSD